ncbi:MAG: hypothetical protein IKF83_01080 [Clostridia bacterium]|nr:hypothetical protein [Clostridia bacterium]
MEKKEPIKISLPLFITIIVLLVAIISGIYVYMQNQKLDEEIAGLKEQISKTQTEKNELQERLNKISDVTSNVDNKDITPSKEKEETTALTQEISESGYSAKLEDDNITITLKSQDGMWTNSDFNKPINNTSYTVSGLDKGIKKIIAANRATDVSPEVMILMKDGTVSSVDLSGPIIKVMYGTKNPEDIKFKCIKIEELKDIEDINVRGDYHYAIDKNGKEIKIWDNKL